MEVSESWLEEAHFGNKQTPNTAGVIFLISLKL